MMNYGVQQASFVKALVALVIVAAVLGGVALASATDAFSEIPVSNAKAGQIEAETAQQQQKWELMVPYEATRIAGEAAVLAAELAGQEFLAQQDASAAVIEREAEKTAYLAELAEGQRVEEIRNNQQLGAEAQRNEFGNIVLLVAGVVAVIVLAIPLLFVLIRLSTYIPTKVHTVQLAAKPASISGAAAIRRDSPQMERERRKQREAARRREFVERKRRLDRERLRQIEPFRRDGSDYDSLPLVE